MKGGGFLYDIFISVFHRFFVKNPIYEKISKKIDNFKKNPTVISLFNSYEEATGYNKNEPLVMRYIDYINILNYVSKFIILKQ